MTSPDTTRARDPRTVRRVIDAFRPYRGRLLGVGGMVMLTAGLGVANPLLIRPLFDRGLFPPGSGPNVGLVMWLAGGMIAISAFTGVLGIWQTYLANVLGQRVMQDLRNTLYAHLQRMPLRFFTDTKTGEIQSRLANDVGGVQSVVTDTASSVLSNVVTLLSTLVAMILLSVPLTVLSLALMPLFMWLSQRVGRARREVSKSTQQTMADLSALSQETLSVSGILLSKSFGRQRQEVGRYREGSARLADLQIRQQMIGRSFFALMMMFFSSMPALVYIVAAVVRGSGSDLLSAGTIVAFTTLQSRLFFPLATLFEVSVQVQSSLALFDRIFEYLDLPFEIEDAPDAIMVDPERVRGAISLRNVSFRYPAAESPDSPESPASSASSASSASRAERAPAPVDGSAAPDRPWALQDITLDIEPGQLAAIVGASGSGKTTLSYLLPRLYDVTNGAVLIDGTDVRRWRLDSLAAAIGMVTQETYLFHASVRENLRYGKPDADDDELEAAARAAAIYDRVLQLDDGFDTVVGERGYRMSGGEKQRLAIARVLLKDPRILVLDEATSALDSTNERLVQQALEPLMAGRTTLAIAHRLSTILAADVIFVFDRGRLVERGTHTELLDRGARYAQLYLQQFNGGTVEARCADGLVLRSGEIVRTARNSAP